MWLGFGGFPQAIESSRPSPHIPEADPDRVTSACKPTLQPKGFRLRGSLRVYTIQVGCF